jgi:haloalkane dehalogenase
MSLSVPTARGRLHVVDHPGEEPPFVLMHGFPDDSHIYDRLAPLLAPRRVVTFDFLGYGGSDREVAPTSRAANHHENLASVLTSLGLEEVTLVGHDASGPIAIDDAIDHPGRVRHLVLLNTYYGHAPMLRLPEMIRLFADDDFAPLTDALMADPDQRLWLLEHTARQWGARDVDPNGVEAVSVVPQFFGDADRPDALSAIRRWTAALFTDLDQQDTRIATHRLATLDIPVTLVFGENDVYLSPDLAHHLAGYFRGAAVRIVESASHWPQWDRPEVVAQLLAEAALV